MASSSTTHRPAAVTHPTTKKVIAHPTLGLRLYNARKKAALAKQKAAKARKLASIRAYEVKQRAAFMSKLLVEASRHRGAPYAYGSIGPSSFDCSGFTRYVFAKMGVALPHTSYGQYAMTTHIPASQAQPGDLLFFDGNGHVGIYAGHGLMWDASRPGGSVELRAPYGPFLVGRVKV